MAQAMMWVNDAFGWPVSARWLLITRRFSSSTLTGMLRIEVAVGMVSDISMFWAILPAAPRRGTEVWLAGAFGCCVGTVGAIGAGAISTGAGAVSGCAASS